MFVLLDHIDWSTGENAYPSQKTLAQACGCSVTQVQNDLDAIIAAGEMEKETRKTRKGNRGNRYKLTPRETKQGWSRVDTKSVRSDSKSVDRDTKSVGVRDQAHLAGTSPIEPPTTEPAPSEPARVRARGENNGKFPRGPSPAVNIQKDPPPQQTTSGVNGQQDSDDLKPVPADTKSAWSRDSLDCEEIRQVLKHVPPHLFINHVGIADLIALGFGFERGTVKSWPNWYVGNVCEVAA
jgi:hypothetical protein